jgi:hypothetical protein
VYTIFGGPVYISSFFYAKVFGHSTHNFAKDQKRERTKMGRKGRSISKGIRKRREKIKDEEWEGGEK